MLPDKAQFLKVATIFEGGLVLIAYFVAWAAHLDPLETLRVSAAGLTSGILGTLPLLAFFALTYAYPVTSLREIKRFLEDKLGPLLTRCRWYELLYLGFLAGVSEEILFRGVLQPWLERDWGGIGGLVFSNLIFALAHWITPMYGLLAGLTGGYLGLSMDFGSERNLLVPILIHSIYDFLAFIAVTASYRRSSHG